MANTKLDIMARKSTGEGSTVWIVVDRGEGHTHRFVSATADAHSLVNGEWFWGHYFATFHDAMVHFNQR